MDKNNELYLVYVTVFFPGREIPTAIMKLTDCRDVYDRPDDCFVIDVLISNLDSSDFMEDKTNKNEFEKLSMTV